MNGLKDKLLNVLLYPVRYFERLTDNKATLYAGIALVGAIDLLLPNITAVYKRLFVGKPVTDVYMNAVLLVLMIGILGVIDVIFVSMPLFDFFKYIKKKEWSGFEQEKTNDRGETVVTVMERGAREHTASPVKIMKIYIMSHFIIIPVSTLIYYVFLRHITESGPEWMHYLSVVIFMLIFIWSAALMARGINTLFRFNLILAKLTFIIVFTWNYLFGMVFDMQIMNWLLKLFR